MRKVLTFIGVVVVVGGVASFNHWYRLSNVINLHTEMAKNVRQSLVDRGMRPISWELLKKTQGEFESIPVYPPELKELDGKQVTVVGYGMPLGGDLPSHDDDHGHAHASMLPRILPLLELFKGHVHTQKYNGVPEVMLTPLPLECYWKRLPPLNQALYVRPADPIEFADGAVLGFRGTLELREKEGPKFFFVLKNAELLK
ncbi:MAG TPA: hypothetical protein PLD73_18025 [Candidatus Hydrogenedentes bacterium]|nr:hypothetical protein [Candidatus Hydrogenedentota bacterium]HPJ98696.1 hypothetical protein [Candidatus Hydrogenedentota bacterium]